MKLILQVVIGYISMTDKISLENMKKIKLEYEYGRS